MRNSTCFVFFRSVIFKNSDPYSWLVLLSTGSQRL